MASQGETNRWVQESGAEIRRQFWLVRGVWHLAGNYPSSTICRSYIIRCCRYTSSPLRPTTHPPTQIPTPLTRKFARWPTRTNSRKETRPSYRILDGEWGRISGTRWTLSLPRPQAPNLWLFKCVAKTTDKQSRAQPLSAWCSINQGAEAPLRNAKGLQQQWTFQGIPRTPWPGAGAAGGGWRHHHRQR